MGTRVAASGGRVLQQIAAPCELYDRPVNAFVAGFIGTPAMNLVEVPVDGGRAMVGTAGVDVPASLDGRDRILLGARPEALRVVGESEPNGVRGGPGRGTGAESFAYGSTESGERLGDPPRPRSRHRRCGRAAAGPTSRPRKPRLRHRDRLRVD